MNQSVNKPTIVSMPGDGIGKVVLPAAIRVLEEAGFEAEYVHADIGWQFWCEEGNPLPNRTIELLQQHKIGLFGAITSKPKNEAAKELAPELQDKGLTYYSPIVELRQKFQLDICIRPCQTIPGNPLNFIRRGAGGAIEEPDIDVVIFRQNTEGLYCGVEWTNPPENIRQAFNFHPKFKDFAGVPGEELAISSRIFTLAACERVLKEAFSYADKHGYKSVTICEKPNVLRETSGMLLRTGQRIQKEYPHIQLWDTNIDAMMMWITKNPEDYGVIVAGNMFGDIISDGFAGLVGGLGFACSANVGKEVAVFEPTHGSAPKYGNLVPAIVNPLAMILSGCMLLEHLGEMEKSAAIRRAINGIVSDGKAYTYDMLRLKGGPDAIQQGAASTDQLAAAIIERLGR
ncbi:MAG: isocitrate/isopropylmalate dehydrogenase family protein [Anaerolineales bacterium]|nr:isocitrate/isopropylmalate dehydrogenase family protein [Anaerolineales bacterium]